MCFSRAKLGLNRFKSPNAPFPESCSLPRWCRVLKLLNSTAEQQTLHPSFDLWAAIWTGTNRKLLCSLTNGQYSWGSWNNLVIKSIRRKIYCMHFRVGFPSAPGLHIGFLNIAQALLVFMQQFLEFPCAWQKGLLVFCDITDCFRLYKTIFINFIFHIYSFSFVLLLKIWQADEFQGLNALFCVYEY